MTDADLHALAEQYTTNHTAPVDYSTAFSRAQMFAAWALRLEQERDELLQPHIGGDSQPEGSCLVCGQQRIFFVWTWKSSKSAIGVCQECRMARFRATDDVVARLRERAEQAEAALARVIAERESLLKDFGEDELVLLQQRDAARAELAALREGLNSLQVLGSGAFGDPKWVAWSDIQALLGQLGKK